MAFSREVRLPFPGQAPGRIRVSLPAGFIYRDGVKKAVLRDAVRPDVPSEVLARRDKVGFETPQRRDGSHIPGWRSRIQELLLSANGESRRHVSDRRDRGRFSSWKWRDPDAIWRALVVEIWFELSQPRKRMQHDLIPRRLVVVPYFYPPFPGAGTGGSLARHLRQAGHSVTIVATNAFGVLPGNDETGIIRVGDLRSSPTLRRLLRRGPLISRGRQPQAPPPSILTRVVVPDSHLIGWIPAALAKVSHLAREEGIDCLITSSPPDSNHLIGLLLGRSRPAWIADLRDGWMFESLRDPFPTRPQRALDSWLEGQVVRRADVVVGATRPIVDDLNRRVRANAEWISNAWDPDDDADSTNQNVARSGCSIVYTGTLRVRNFNPEPLMRAVSVVRGEGCDLRLTVAGTVTGADQALVDNLGLANGVEYLGTVSRSASLALQRSGDALLLVSARDRSVATSKLFEYFGAGKPILALAEGNEAARLVQELVRVSRSRPTMSTRSQMRFAKSSQGEIAKSFAPRNLEDFTYPGPGRGDGTSGRDCTRAPGGIEVMAAAAGPRGQRIPGLSGMSEYASATVATDAASENESRFRSNHS